MAGRDHAHRRLSTKRVLFITHADVAIDPAIPVPSWPLSPIGRARHEAFNRAGPIARVSAIYCSDETKAMDGAAILARAVGVAPVVRACLRENDRSATGYLPPAAFQAMANRFFGNPHDSVRGWERAIDAQDRIARCVGEIVRADASGGDIAIVAHGGVGALLLCRLLRVAITRGYDQPGRGGGNWFAFDRATGAVIHGWRDIATCG